MSALENESYDYNRDEESAAVLWTHVHLALRRFAAWQCGRKSLTNKTRFSRQPAIASQSRVFRLEQVPVVCRANERKTTMNRNYRKLTARFEPETRFEVPPVPT